MAKVSPPAPRSSSVGRLAPSITPDSRSSNPEPVLRAAELIERKRDGHELEEGELAALVLAYARGDIPDEQMAAFCMAVYFRGLSRAETHALTDAMIRSGETVDLSPLGRVCVVKHSTGGVGDKTSCPRTGACMPYAT